MSYWNDVNSKLQLSNAKYAFYLGDYSYNDCINSQIANKIPKQKVGWGRRAVDIRANKTKFDRFENDVLDFNGLFTKYGVLNAFDKVKDDVLVCGCGFLAVNGDKVFPFTAQEATGTFSWFEQNLKDGVAVFRKDTRKLINGGMDVAPRSYIQYRPDVTIVHDDGAVHMQPNTTGRPLIGLLTHHSSAKRPFGSSVLTASARSAIIDASRAVRQAMIAAHYYNTKVDVILGVDSDTNIDKIERQSGDVLTVGTNENGQIPQLGQLAQHAMSPFNDTIMTAARNFCADTKLGLANLGISSDAPQSTEALEIINDDLRDDILRWQDELGEQLKYFATTLYLREHNLSSIDDNLRAKIAATKPTFLSVYRQDISKFGDGLTKIAQQAPAITKSRSVWHNLGLTSSEIDEVISSANSGSLTV